MDAGRWGLLGVWQWTRWKEQGRGSRGGSDQLDEGDDKGWGAGGRRASSQNEIAAAA